MGQADKPTFTNTAQVTGTFAAKNYAIEFETGKATFTSAATRTLNELVDQVSISGLLVQIEGHTDAVGDPTSNLELSKRRADAVKQFLMTNAGSSFPPERVRTRGFGDSSPVADNKTADGRAKNRRVEVKLQTTN
jgi:outer membrane protein OmpA-like peptidoglycan-associated protein